jgi:ribosomal protein S18 acetylase RimI-like enzyme
METPLIEVGLRPTEYIVTYERAVGTLPRLPPLSHVRFRPARPDDVGKLTALDTAAFTSLWRLASGELIELLITSGRFVVAERESDLVGYACSDVRGNLGRIHRLVVHPSTQGQGIGHTLLADALIYCQAAGASLVMINTQQSNRASDRLYRDFGFRPVSQRVPVLMGEVARQGDSAT